MWFCRQGPTFRSDLLPQSSRVKSATLQLKSTDSSETWIFGYQITRCHSQKTIILVQLYLYLHLWLWLNCSNENLKSIGSKPYPLHIGKYKEPTHIAVKHYTIASLHSGYMWHIQCRVHYNLIIARLKKALNLFTCIYHTRRVIYLSWHRFEWRWKRLVLHQAAPKRDIVLNNRYLGGGLSPVRYCTMRRHRQRNSCMHEFQNRRPSKDIFHHRDLLSFLLDAVYSFRCFDCLSPSLYLDRKQIKKQGDPLKCFNTTFP